MSDIVAEIIVRPFEAPESKISVERGETIQIGRGDGNNFRIASPKASRFHAAVRSTKEGVVLQDLGSLNGTLLNGKLIGATSPLKSGDRFFIAGVEFIVMLFDHGDASQYPSDETKPVELQVHRGTILVSDIRGYTALSESLPAQELTAVLRVWTERVTTVVETLDGVIDKFIGDSVLAYWLRESNSKAVNDQQLAEKALLAAKRIEAETVALESSVLWPFAPKHRWTVKSSLASGEVIFGNVGRGDARTFTVFGNAVNVAFRLNDLCSELGIDVLADEATAELSSSVAKFRYLQDAHLEGKSEVVKVYNIRSTEKFPS